jgi:hypothetical protein
VSGRFWTLEGGTTVKHWIVILSISGLGILACTEDGPMEKAGKQFDDTVERIQHGDEGTLEKAGRKTDEAIEEAEEDFKERQRE